MEKRKRGSTEDFSVQKKVYFSFCTLITQARHEDQTILIDRDCLLHVFTRLAPDEVCCVLSTSKFWYETGTAPELWRQYCAHYLFFQTPPCTPLVLA